MSRQNYVAKAKGEPLPYGELPFGGSSIGNALYKLFAHGSKDSVTQQRAVTAARWVDRALRIGLAVTAGFFTAGASVAAGSFSQIAPLVGTSISLAHGVVRLRQDKQSVKELQELVTSINAEFDTMKQDIQRLRQDTQKAKSERPGEALALDAQAAALDVLLKDIEAARDEILTEVETLKRSMPQARGDRVGILLAAGNLMSIVLDGFVPGFAVKLDTASADSGVPLQFVPFVSGSILIPSVQGQVDGLAPVMGLQAVILDAAADGQVHQRWGDFEKEANRVLVSEHREPTKKARLDVILKLMSRMLDSQELTASGAARILAALTPPEFQAAAVRYLSESLVAEQVAVEAMACRVSNGSGGEGEVRQILSKVPGEQRARIAGFEAKGQGAMTVTRVARELMGSPQEAVEPTPDRTERETKEAIDKLHAMDAEAFEVAARRYLDGSADDEQLVLRAIPLRIRGGAMTAAQAREILAGRGLDQLDRLVGYSEAAAGPLSHLMMAITQDCRVSKIAGLGDTVFQAVEGRYRGAGAEGKQVLLEALALRVARGTTTDAQAARIREELNEQPGEAEAAQARVARRAEFSANFDVMVEMKRKDFKESAKGLLEVGSDEVKQMVLAALAARVGGAKDPGKEVREVFSDFEVADLWRFAELAAGVDAEDELVLPAIQELIMEGLADIESPTLFREVAEDLFTHGTGNQQKMLLLAMIQRIEDRQTSDPQAKQILRGLSADRLNRIAGIRLDEALEAGAQLLRGYAREVLQEGPRRAQNADAARLLEELVDDVEAKDPSEIEAIFRRKTVEELRSVVSLMSARVSDTEKRVVERAREKLFEQLVAQPDREMFEEQAISFLNGTREEQLMMLAVMANRIAAERTVQGDVEAIVSSAPFGLQREIADSQKLALQGDATRLIGEWTRNRLDNRPG